MRLTPEKSVEMSSAEKKAGRIWIQYFTKLMSELENKGKINPNRIKEMKKFFRIYNFANQSALHINKFDRIVRDHSERKKFLEKNVDFESDLLDEIWFDLLVLSTLRCYWLIEISLIILLKDIQYGKKGIVEGKENLGTLKSILTLLNVEKRIDWSAIDITFRNALAHGWFYRKKQIFVYYTNSKLNKGKKLDIKKLILKCKIIQVYTIVIAGLVGDWKNLDNFGSKDPLR